jgi:hypothetical protein
MANKSEAKDRVIEWMNAMKSQGIKLESYCTIRTDNGGEFTSDGFISAISAEGLKRELSPPYGHVYVAERVIRTLQSNARAMMFTEGLTTGFWAEAIAYATYSYNRLNSKSSIGKTKYELLFNRKPDVSNMRTFGCVVWAHKYDEVRKK